MSTANCPDSIALIAMPGMEEFVDRVQNHFRYNDRYCRISMHTVPFADTTSKPVIEDSVRRREVYLFCDFTKPNTDVALGNIDRTLNALEAGHAERISLFAPYISNMRQDHSDINVRSSISAQATIEQLSRYRHVEHIITLDLHAPQIEGFARPGLIDNLAGAVVLGQYFDEKFNNDYSNVTSVSPDVGGLKRARAFAESLHKGMIVGSIDKRRDGPNMAEAISYIGKPEDIEGHDLLVIDDLIDTAISVVNGTRILRQYHPKSITIAATAGVLSEKNGITAEQRFRDEGLQVVITEAIWRPAEYYAPNKDWLTCLSLDDLAAKAIFESSRVGGSLQQLKRYSRECPLQIRRL